MRNPLLMVYTHDSVGLGEDGPTHQPVEMLVGMRSVPNLWSVRPGDANESVYAWKIALQRRDGPTCLILTRQKLPIFNRKEVAPAEGVMRGAYILAEAEGGKPELIIIATGSEVALAIEARTKLQEQGVNTRVVSMPCRELYDEQDQSYKDEVLPPDVKKRLSVEAASPMAWLRYVGDQGDIIGIETFGASAPAEVIFKKYGFTVENVVEHGLALVGRREPLPPERTWRAALADWDKYDETLHERELERTMSTQTAMETPAEKQS
jgi:transketolase